MLNGELKFTYTNYKGIKSERRVQPNNLWFGSTEYHKKKQWLLCAYDLDKEAFRDFALNDMVGDNIKIGIPKHQVPITPVREWYL